MNYLNVKFHTEVSILKYGYRAVDISHTETIDQ